MPLPEDLYAELDRRLAPVDAARAATYAFYRAALPAAAARLAAYLERVDGGVLDEPATARALATVVLRGLDCGALDDAEVRTVTGVERPVLERLAGRAARITLPATGSGGRRPTIPS